MRKKMLRGVLSLVLCSAAVSVLADDCKRMVVTGHPGYPPLLWGSGSTLRGAPIRLLEKLAAERGIEVQAVNPMTWDKAMTDLKSGQADAIAGIYYNSEREVFLEFIRPAWIQDPVSVIAAKGKSFKFAGLSDLVGKKGVAGKGESFGADIDSYIAQKLNVSRADTVTEALDMLVAGQADFLINGTFPALKVAIERGIKDKVVVLEPPLVTEDAYLAFSKKSPCKHLASDFGKRVAEMHKSGETNSLVREAANAWEAERK